MYIYIRGIRINVNKRVLPGTGWLIRNGQRRSRRTFDDRSNETAAAERSSCEIKNNPSESMAEDTRHGNTDHRKFALINVSRDISPFCDRETTKNDTKSMSPVVHRGEYVAEK